MTDVFIPLFLHKTMGSIKILKTQRTMLRLKKMKKKDRKKIITMRKMNFRMKMLLIGTLMQLTKIYKMKAKRMKQARMKNMKKNLVIM